MNKMTRILIGLATILPVVYIVGSIIFLGRIIDQLSSSGGNPLPVFIVHGSVMLIAFGVVIFYAVHITRNRLLPDNDKMLWIVLLLIIGVFTMPIYWYRYIWQDYNR